MKKKNKAPLLKVASVSKVHGIRGEIFVRPLNKHADWPQPLKEIFIGNQVFPVQKYSPHKEGIIFKLKDCDTRQSAETLKTQSVFLPKKLFKSKKGEAIYLAELQSFSVEILGQGSIGTVQAFQSDKFQDILLIQLKGTKKLITVPFTKEYLQHIDFSKKKLVLNLPKNFLEIFSSR